MRITFSARKHHPFCIKWPVSTFDGIFSLALFRLGTFSAVCFAHWMECELNLRQFTRWKLRANESHESNLSIQIASWMRHKVCWISHSECPWIFIDLRARWRSEFMRFSSRNSQNQKFKQKLTIFIFVQPPIWRSRLLLWPHDDINTHCNWWSDDLRDLSTNYWWQFGCVVNSARKWNKCKWMNHINEFEWRAVI